MVIESCVVNLLDFLGRDFHVVEVCCAHRRKYMSEADVKPCLSLVLWMENGGEESHLQSPIFLEFQYCN